MGNLSGNDFMHCPEMVMYDVIRMWSQINGNLPGVSVTTPTFSDGFIDVNPSLVGPQFSIFDQSIRLTRPKADHFNRCYSSFIYSPEKFRNEMPRTGQWALSTDIKCTDHYFAQLGKRYCIDNRDSMEHIHSHCTPLPDRLKPLGHTDDLFAKVPQSNAAMRNSIMLCNTLQCLTLFENSERQPEDNMVAGVVDDGIIDYSLHLSILKLIHDDEIHDWSEFYFSNLLNRSSNLLLLSKENSMQCFMCNDNLEKFSMAFLFHMGNTMNDGVCMVHEGGKVPGRGSKSSLLTQEFSRNGECQYIATKGECLLKLIFYSNIFTQSHKKNRSLSTSEYRNMQENLEHDRMICANYDRQTITFSAERDNEFHYSFNNYDGLIDEMQFLSCSHHEYSEMAKIDWKLSRDDHLGLMVGGLRSPCLNAMYPVHSRDELGL